MEKLYEYLVQKSDDLAEGSSKIKFAPFLGILKESGTKYQTRGVLIESSELKKIKNDMKNYRCRNYISGRFINLYDIIDEDIRYWKWTAFIYIPDRKVMTFHVGYKTKDFEKEITQLLPTTVADFSHVIEFLGEDSIFHE